jgi:CheY-like chemotaxis protein
MEALGQLAGGISHDFNNLLAAILGSCEFIHNDPADAEAVKEHTLEIQKAATTAAASTKQLLAFSRRQVMLPRVLDLNQVVRDMEKILQRLIGENIELIGNLDDDVWPVLADPSQISQVIMNLAINGRDAMPAGGILTIATSKAFLSDLDLGTSHGSSAGGLRAGDYTCLSVKDAGCGMDQSVLARVFEPFFSTKGPKKGSGLGMATVYGIVTQSKGHIDIDSELNKGTTVRVYLPRSREEAKTYGLPSPTTALGENVEQLGGSETILLVEDERPMRTLAKRILEMYGYKMITAADAESALEGFELHGGLVDLLLTDVVLPGMRGPDLAEKLRITQPQLKVLYMSGYTDTDMAQQDLLDEVAGYLQKPFHSSELIREVRRLLDNK